MRRSDAGGREGLDTDSRYTHPSFRGVALRIEGWAQVWDPETYLVIDEETGEEYQQESGDGEWIDDPDRENVIVVMVGDDAEHQVELADLTPISDDDYCSECGQVGCYGDGRPVENEEG